MIDRTRVTACILSVIAVLLALLTSTVLPIQNQNNSEAIQSGKQFTIVENTNIPSIDETPDNFSSWAEIAIAWAEYRLGSSNWYGMCTNFVANAFMNTEATSWNDPNDKFEEASAIDLPSIFSLTLNNTEYGGWEQAPRGALIFFDKVSDDSYGHVAIYLGNNQIIHALGIVTISNIDNLKAEPKIYGEYIGWAYPADPDWRPENETPQTQKTYARDVKSPISLRIYDSANRVTGLVDDEAKMEIPGSLYHPNAREITVVQTFDTSRFDTYRIEIQSDEEGVYDLTVITSDTIGLLSLNIKNVPIALGEIHQYGIDIDREKLIDGESGITMTVDGEIVDTPIPRITFEPYVISSTGPYEYEGTLNYWRVMVVSRE